MTTSSIPWKGARLVPELKSAEEDRCKDAAGVTLPVDVVVARLTTGKRERLRGGMKLGNPSQIRLSPKVDQEVAALADAKSMEISSIKRIIFECAWEGSLGSPSLRDVLWKLL